MNVQKIEKKEISGVSALTPLQEGLLYQYLKNPTSGYVEQLDLEIAGLVDEALFWDAWDVVVCSHDALRTMFRWEGVNHPVQVVKKTHRLSRISEDFSRHSADDALSRFQTAKTKLRDPAALMAGVPFKVALYKTGDEVFHIVVTHHHILYDGWSNSILLRQFMNVYGILASGGIPVETEGPGFQTFVKWLGKQDRQAQKRYWDGYLEGHEHSGLGLKLAASPSTQGAGSENKRLTVPLDQELIRRLQECSRQRSVTLATLFYTAWGVVLQQMCCRQSVVFGATVSGRRGDLEGVEEIVGLCINTVPLGFDPGPNMTVAEVLGRVALDLRRREPFENAAMEGELFDTIVVVENYPLDPASLKGDASSPLNIRSYDFVEGTHYDVTVCVRLLKERALIELLYPAGRFVSGEVSKLGARLTTVLQRMMEDPFLVLGRLNCVGDDERDAVLRRLNQDDTSEGQIQDLLTRFYSAAASSPSRMALVGSGVGCADVGLTYGELLQRVSIMAAALKRRGVGPGRIVAVKMEPSVELVIAVYGALSIGSAYLPLAPSLPKARVDYILDDCGVEVVVDDATIEEIKETDHCAEAYEPLVDAMAPAYVIYTSGSTGTPKGVLVERRAVANTLRALAGRYPVEAGDVVCFKTSFMFDVSVTELFGWCWGAGMLAIVGASVAKDPAALLRAVRRWGVTHLNFVPSMFSLFLDAIDEGNRNCLRSIKYIFLAGEAVLPEMVMKFRRLKSRIILENIYGPTEAAIYASWYSLGQLPHAEGPVPIGGPLPGVFLAVLDHWGRVQPDGVAGELHIGGSGLARGYVNQQRLTARRFVRYKEIGDRRLYKTGDLARVNASGEVEFLGRIDHQVKIRGYRVELGEIENCLLRHPAVKEAVVRALEVADGELKLCAYVTAVEGEGIDEGDLRAFLLETLPDYMAPAYFTVMDRFPQTTGGKIDLNRLTRPLTLDMENSVSRGEEALDDLEIEVAGMCAQLLGVEEVGSRDNFFDVGGNSYTLIRLASRLKKRLGVEVPVVTLLRYPTVRQLSRHVKSLLSGEKETPEKRESIAPAAASMPTTSGIAVIGMAGRFPGASDTRQFWHNLINGEESIRHFSYDELLDEGIEGDLIDRPGYVKAKGVLDDADCFDPAFFDYTPAQARLMDPQIRIFHQCCVHALEDAGVDSFAYKGRIGLFAGSTTNAQWLLSKAAEVRDAADQYELINLNSNSFVTLVAYKLDLKGPAMAIQTACSTSLVAVDAACRSLLTGACHIALAGGVSVTLPIKSGYLYQEGMIQSPDGHCRAFDAEASGTLEGNGVGMVVLKPLAAALADGDVIDAVVKGTAVNNDGLAKVGYTAPSIEGQGRAIADAQAAAGVEPRTIGYIEAHGTGTPLGDPVEVEGLRLAFGDGGYGYCLLGSVKTNIGHLDAAAGIAGFIKTVLVLKHQLIPPSLHFKTPNPKIDFERSPFRVNNDLAAWDDADHPRRAGVSSFGIGGTNAHVVLEEAPTVPKSRPSARRFQLLVQSAKSPAVLERMRRDLELWLIQENEERSDGFLKDAAFTLATGRREFPFRGFWLDGEVREATAGEPDVVFMFSGQGSQYAGMGRDLYQYEPLFREELDRCFALLKPLLEADPEEVLFGSADNGPVGETALAQPLIFAVEYALARLLIHWGVQPAAMIGHSIGEYVAATLAGVFHLEEALRLVVARGRSMQRMPAGSMVAVGAGEREIEPFLDTGVELAAVNGDAHVVISGSHHHVEAAVLKLEAEGFKCSRLHTSHAFHSMMMEPVLEEFRQAFENVTLTKPSIRFISNVTGAWIKAGQALSPNYWVNHLRRTVRFGDGLEEILRKDNRVLVEIGAGRSLCTFARNHRAKQKGHSILQSMRHPKDETPDDRFLLNVIGRLWLRGVAVDWRGFYAHEHPRKIHVPGYSFEKTRFPVNARGLSLESRQDQAESIEGAGDNRPNLSSSYVAAENDIQRRLIVLWQRFFGIAPIGAADDFFELGGDSLKVSSMAARLMDEFGVKVPLQEFFNRSTIRLLGEFISGAAATPALSPPLVEKMDVYPLSPAQQRIYIAQQLEPESVLYNMPVVMELKGEIDLERIKRSLGLLMGRHESLRIACLAKEDELVQRVCEIGEVPLEAWSFPGESDTDIIRRFVRPFDLSMAPLFRVALVKAGENRYLLLFDIHHIVSDGASMGILVRDFMALYRDDPLPELTAGYCDFAGWSFGRRSHMEEQIAFWRDQLQAPLPMNRLPTDFSLQPETVTGDLLMTILEPRLSEALKQLARRSDATLYMVLFSLYSLLVANLCGQEDVVVGTATHGRSAGWMEPLVGMFVNTLAIRVKPSFSQYYSQFLEELNHHLLECFQHQDVPLEDVVEDPNQLLDTMFVLQNMEVPDLRLPGLEVADIPYHHKVARFHLTLMAQETDSGIHLAWEYNDSLFRRRTIERFAGYFKEIARAIVDEPGVLVRDIKMLGKDEETLIVEVFGKSEDFYDNPLTFQRMLTEQVERNPDAQVLSGFGPQEGDDWWQLTYAELDRRANRLARKLQRKGVARQDIVALMAPRSPEAVVALVGILKCGAVYLPIEEHLPFERKRFMLNDSAASFCITDEMDDNGDDSPLRDIGAADDAAYIIYTSGTTGTPKGVVVEHRGLRGLRQYFLQHFPVGPEARVLQFAAFSFDASVWEIVMGLLTGSTLVMTPDAIKMDGVLLQVFMKRRKITIATLPPAVAGYLDPGDLDHLKCLITAGSEASAVVMEAWRSRALTVNAYGPTETTVCAACWIAPSEGELPDSIPIGRPFADAEVSIVDPYGRLCPIGVAGEIVVSGPCVARGYLNRPQLTAELFKRPVKDETVRGYRTGDRGRWTADGMIEFLGRLDNQVNIRGFRVEPGEVQAVLSLFPGIQDCWILPIEEEDGDVCLVGYVVAIGDRRSDDELRHDVRNFLLERLPGYMIPNHLIPVEEIPLTAHGKPDRTRLPNSFEGSVSNVEPPAGEGELALAELWSWVLTIPLESIGRDSHFFAIGGQSLKAVRLAARIQWQTGKTVTVTEIFRHPTLREMTRYIETVTGRHVYPPLRAYEKKDYYPASSVQRRLFIVQEQDPTSVAYNMPIILTLEGELDRELLWRVFNQLVARHESYRTTFSTIDGQLAQRVSSVVELSVQRYEAETFVRPFDLTVAPLLRVATAEVAEDTHILAVDMHHIIADGASMEILVSEFLDLYRKRTLPPVDIHYRDFSLWLEADGVKLVLDLQKKFWVRQFSGNIPRLRLPNDFAVGAVQSEGGRIEFNVGAMSTSGLKRLAEKERATLFMVVLAAYYAWLSYLSGQEDIVIGVGNNGRLLPETNGMIGMFVNTLPLRLTVDPGVGFRRFLGQVRDYTLHAFDNQYYPFEDLVEAVGAVASPGRNPLFDVMLRFDDLEIPEFKLPGMRLTVNEQELQASKFHLTLAAAEYEGCLKVALEYNGGLFERDTARIMVEQLRRILEAAASGGECSLRQLTAPPKEERERILECLNTDIKRGVAEFSDSMVMQRKIRESMSEHRDAVALQQGDLALSYGALGQRVVTIAQFLKSRGIGTGIIVGILLKERIQVIASILAIIEVGGVFVPLDPESPEQRLKTMIKSANCSMILGVEEIERLDGESEYGSRKSWDDVAEYSPDDPLYIYFTSGTTGVPRGFLGKNNSLLHFIQWEREYLGIGKGDRFSQLIVPTFDAFLRDLFVPLLSGGRVCLLPDPDIMLEGGALGGFLEQADVQVVHCVPSVFRLILSGRLNSSSFPGLRSVLMSGENVDPRDLERWFQIMGERVGLFNLYGTSETTMAKCSHPIRLDDALRERIPVGTGINGAAMVVLDSKGYVRGPLAVGEIYIGTGYATAGYVDDPELTQKKFNGYLMGEDRLPPLYRTGDLGRALADGSLEYLGREDRQVKIRGIRVELAEVERTLRQHPDVDEGAVVFKRENDVESLYAFVSPVVGDVASFLENRLPSYMMPSRIVPLRHLPRTVNGKIDYNGLEGMIEASAGPVIPPANRVEERLLELWRESFKSQVMGVETPFFEVGGNSLNLMKLLLKIQREFDAQMALHDLFRLPTVRQQAEFLSHSVVLDEERLEKSEKLDYYPLSPQQSRLYFLQQLNPGGIHYNMSSCFLVEGDVDVDRLTETIRELSLRQHSLRTSFAMLEGHPIQWIVEPREFDVEFQCIDGNGGDMNGMTELIRRFIRPFDLSVAPLFRLGLIDMGNHKWVLVLDYHHIIGDGISGELFIEECMAIYRGQSLEPPVLQYVDFAVWQNQSQSVKPVGGYREYWLNRFSGEIPVLELPLDFDRPSIQDISGQRIPFTLPENSVDRLFQLAESMDATLFMVLLSAFYVFLARMSGQLDIVVGTPVAGRTRKELQSIIGMFVNSLALRHRIEPGDTFDDLLRRVKQDTMAALTNQEYQFEDLVEELGVQRDLARNPLFDVMFVLQNYEKNEISLPGLSISSYQYAPPVSRFDLTLWAWEMDGGLDFSLEYCTRLFRPSSARHFVEYFKRIVSAILEDPLQPLITIDILTEGEKNQLVMHFNDSSLPYPRESSIHDVVTGFAKAFPGKIAVEMESRLLSYSELHKKSQVVAARLAEEGLSLEEPVGLMAYNGIEFIVGLLGILTAGGVVMPMDPELPESRLSFMTGDASCDIIINPLDIQVDSQGIEDSKTLPANPVVHPHNLAYIIYSSGTTGKPKGSLLSHKSITRLLAGPGIVGFQPGDRYMQLANYMFDVSIFDMFTPLLNGGTLLLLDKTRIMEPGFLTEAILRHSATMTFFPTSLFNVLVESDIQRFSPLRKIVVGGEALSFAHTKKALEYLGPGRIVNGYGPSENSMFTTFYEFFQLEGSRVPIGKPCPNSRVYIIDSYGSLQPKGIIGELCVAGDGLARGYMNRPQLTAERFVSHPWIPNERIYRTGDLARWLPDGNLEFFGRIDHQVKIRGFRVELGEIETHISECADVKEAVVLALTDHHHTAYLCAYIVPARDPISIDRVRDYLAGVLPSYMVPASFVVLDALPLNSNGKVDRQALPDPDTMTERREDDEPRDELERKLVEVWAGVLGRPARQLGVRRKFFDCGGQSLKATILIARIYKEFHVRMPLADFYRAPTIEEMADWIRKSNQRMFTDIPVAEEREYYPLSYAQKRLYFLSRLEPDSTGYNLTTALSVVGALDLQKVEETFKTLMARHEIFRTSFEEVDDQPVQVIHPEASFELEFVTQPELSVSQCIRPFDLSKIPLFRVLLARVEDNRHIMMLDMHHIISDGTSMNLLVREFSRFYSQEECPPLSIQYNDFAVWQQERAQQESLENQKSFWLGQLAGELPVLNLPLDFARPANRSFAGCRYDFSIDGELLWSLKTVASENDATLFMLLLALVDIFLARICRQEDIIIGAPIAGRTHSQLEPLVGMFVNTLALRNFPKMEMTFREFVKGVQNRTIKAFENQEFPFELLVDLLATNRDMSRNPLFDMMVALQNMEMDDIDIPGLTIRPYRYSSQSSKFDLSLVGIEANDTLALSFEYSTDLFRRDTIERFARHFLYIARQVADGSRLFLREIELISPCEKRKILYEFHGETMEMPDEPVHRLFERQVLLAGDRVAVEFEDGALSYRELNEQSNRLARRLAESNVNIENPVAIHLDRSLEMIIAIMGVLKAGSAYIPLDPTYPPERSEYILRDSNAPCVIVAGVGWRLKAQHVEFLDIMDTQRSSKIASGNLPQTCTHLDPAYIIYTSGTTGRPKGVLVEHRSLVNLIVYMAISFDIDVSDRILQFSSYCFDASIEQIFLALTRGARLVEVSRETILHLDLFYDYIVTRKVTHVHSVPSFLKMLEIPGHTHIKRVVSGGDTCLPGLVEKFSGKYRFYNEYGPTETTVTSLKLSVSSIEVDGYVPIGRPLGNTTAYILEPHGSLLPDGIPGELYIGGHGVARGYLNQPELTSEKFIENPHICGERLYKTGDLVKRDAVTGDIEFLGRIDHQIKIRGFRIETAEIEGVLLEYPGMSEAVVTAPQSRDGDRFLCAYLSGDNRELSSDLLKRHVSLKLPEYMIPSCFVFVDSIPLNANGKVDRAALPEPDMADDRVLAAPVSDLEKKLANLWSGALDMEADEIGVKDNFFNLGGHSLKATILMSRIERELEVKIPLAEIFRSPTIRELAAYIKGRAASALQRIPVAEEMRYYPLSPSQRMIYIEQQMEAGNLNYNISALVRLRGKLDIQQLSRVFQSLVERHEGFRTSFIIVDGEPKQWIAAPEEAEFKVVLAERQQTLIQEFIRPFDLASAPLLRVELVKVENQEFLLLVDMHHIIADGASIGILMREFMDLYAGRSLPPLGIQYKDYAVWLRDDKQMQRLERQEEFWLDEFSGPLPRLRLPFDFPKVKQTNYEGQRLNFQFPVELYREIETMAAGYGITLFMALFGAFNILMARLGNEEEVVVGTPVANRRHPDLEPVIGMFVNTLALRNNVSEEQTVRDYYLTIKERTLQAFENQEYPFESLAKRLMEEQDLERSSIFDVFFSMVKDDIPEVSIKGLAMTSESHQYTRTPWDLVFICTESNSSLQVSFLYPIALFKEETIQRFFNYFIEILSVVVQGDHIQVKDIYISHRFADSDHSILEEATGDFDF